MDTAAQPLLLELVDTFVSGREIALTVGGFQIRAASGDRTSEIANSGAGGGHPHAQHTRVK